MVNRKSEDDDRTEKADERYFAWCTSEWVGMPEYHQEELRPRYQVQVNFSGREDMDKFSRMIGADITPKTRSVWYPPVEEINILGYLRYIDEKNLEIPGAFDNDWPLHKLEAGEPSDPVTDAPENSDRVSASDVPASEQAEIVIPWEQKEAVSES